MRRCDDAPDASGAYAAAIPDVDSVLPGAGKFEELTSLDVALPDMLVKYNAAQTAHTASTTTTIIHVFLFILSSILRSVSCVADSFSDS